MSPENYELHKWLWTELDFEEMGWHDVTIHAVAFLPEVYELALDIDYIFHWVDPAAGETQFKFWVAPATLVFENVNELAIDLEPHGSIELHGIERSEPHKPKNIDVVDRDIEWRWTLETQSGEINLRSIGYKQYIRRAPVLSRAQVLDIGARGGFSFQRGMN